MTFTAKQLQEEQKPWILHNFGAGFPYQPLLGMFEELGELTQYVRDWNVAEIKDSLADFVVFSADYCTKRGWDLEKIMYLPGVTASPVRDLEAAVHEVYVAVSKIAHHQLKTEQNIRGSADEHAEKAKAELYWALIHIESIALHFGWNLMEITGEVWARVKQRDFKRDQRTGGELPPPAERA